jgi:tetratricopeptide (TPR) repeat protein
MMLLALMAFSVGMIFARRGAAGTVPNAQLAALKAAVTKPDVKWDTWLKYGQALQAAKQYKDAAVAYEQVLKSDPYQSDARRGGAYCKAILGDKDAFYRFMRETTDLAPKLAKAIFEQPYAAVYLAEARFQTVKMDAIAGSMD